MKKAKKVEKRFCSKCSRECLYSEYGAEDFVKYWLSEGKVYYPAYSTLTGERNLVRVYRCPNRKYVAKKWFGNEKTYTDDSHSKILLKLF